MLWRSFDTPRRGEPWLGDTCFEIDYKNVLSLRFRLGEVAGEQGNELMTFFLVNDFDCVSVIEKSCGLS